MILEAQACILAIAADPRFLLSVLDSSDGIDIDRSAPLDLGGIEVEVERCPYPEEGLLATNVAFPLAQRIGRDFRTKSVVPLRIAEVLAERINAGDRFVARTGSLGHVNFSPTGGALRSFLANVIDGAGSPLVTEGTSMAPTPPGVGELIPLRFSWDRFLARNIGADDPDARRLRSQLSSGKRSPREVALMLFGLAGDPELDTEAFVLGLQGRENIPWYIDHTLSQLRVLRALPVENSAEVRSRAVEQLVGDWTSSGKLRSLVLALLEFRASRRYGHRAHRPELLLRAALGLLREFRSVYDRPEARLSPGKRENALAGALYAVAPALVVATEETLRALDPLPPPPPVE